MTIELDLGSVMVNQHAKQVNDYFTGKLLTIHRHTLSSDSSN